MYTYIIESHKLYKIGRAVDMKARLSSYDTHNPYYQVLKVYHGDYEGWLHMKYSKCRVKGEWFQLTEDQVKEIRDIKFPEGVQEVIYKEKVKGRRLTEEEIAYELEMRRRESDNKKLLSELMCNPNKMKIKIVRPSKRRSIY